MAQQNQHQYPPPQRTYSPLPRTDSPHHGLPGPHAPPIKRQPLSPKNQSPYGSPGMANIQLPNQVFSAPYYGAQPNGHSPYGPGGPYNPHQHYGNPATTTNNPNRPYPNQPSASYSPHNPYSPNSVFSPNNPNGASNYNTINLSPQPPFPQPGSAGKMGPPERPADKPTDINELGDVMVGSGIDLREEEAALLNSYSKQRQGPGYGAFSNAGPGYVPPKENLYSQNIPGDRTSFYGAGTFNQQPTPERSAEDIAAENRKRAVRRKAELGSYHLNDPFLSSGCMHRRIAKQTHSMQVGISREGLYTSGPGPAPRQFALQGPDKNEVLKVVQGQDLLTLESPLVEILSLISLAAEERIRSLVEDAATLAKGRRIGSHGIVPSDLADLANGRGSSETVAGLPTPVNSAVSSQDNALKRSYSEINKPLTPVSPDGQAPPRATIANPVAQWLQNSARAERADEEERLAKRQRRTAGDNSRSDSMSTGTPGSSGALGEVAPEADIKKGGKAKDKMDAAAKRALDTQQHAATTSTVNMALGLGGIMGKKLSWMKGGADTGPSNPYQKQTPKAEPSKANTSNANGVGSNLPKGRTFGNFREDKETGARIQLRDLVSVLESDRKEKRSLQRAYGRFGSLRS
ncbi:hypothetical protein ACLMJK_002532 [Lecanora helva]